MSEALSPTPREPRRRAAPGLTWAIILISVGAIALLNNLKVINVNWFDLLRYWPVILILIGLDVLLGRQSLFGSLASAAIAIVVIGGLVWFVSTNSVASTLGATKTVQFSKELGSVDSLDVQLKLGAGQTTLVGLSGGKNVTEGVYHTNTNLNLKVDYDASSKPGRLVIAQTGSENNPQVLGSFVGQLDMKLTDSVPVDLTVDAGVGEVTLDLTDIKLRSLTINAGVGNVSVKLPGSGDFTVNVKAGVGSVDITVPNALEASVTYNGGLSHLDVPSRFAKLDDHRWATSGYESAKDRVLLQIDAGIGNVSISD